MIKPIFDGLSDIEVVETLLIERGEASHEDVVRVIRELDSRGLDHGWYGSAIDMARGGKTFLGTREDALACMKLSMLRAKGGNHDQT